MNTDLARTPPPPRWAVVAAWAVPLSILPSAIWRASMVFDQDDVLGAIGDGEWYFLMLSVLSLGLGLLTVGLVRPWGEVVPRWVPVLGGRTVPARPVATAAQVGGWVLIAVTLYASLWQVVERPFEVTPAIDPDGEQHPEPGWEVFRWYLPMVVWGPLVVAVARSYLRRRTGRTQEPVRVS